jgi:deazaflavin-dependent oxidoreductase (nitroreductase family)
VELSTTGRRSGETRTVTIWFVRDGERLYVQSGKEGKTDWYRNLLANTEVTLRIGTLHLHGRAHAVEGAAENERMHALFEKKYLSARVMGWFGGGFGHGKVAMIDELAEAP